MMLKHLSYVHPDYSEKLVITVLRQYTTISLAVQLVYFTTKLIIASN